MSAPLYLARSGYVVDASTYGMGVYGRYWSNAVYDPEVARYFPFYSSSVVPENYRDRYYGFSLRCVLREFTYSVVGTGPNNNNTIPDGIDLTGGKNVGYAPNAFTTIMATHPLYFMRSGLLNGTTLYYFGGDGVYWSSTVYSSENVRNLYFNSSYVTPENNRYRYYGFSLRCVLRESRDIVYVSYSLHRGT